MSNSATPILPPATVGFVGLGNMGYPMAGRLAAAGYQLVVHDLNADAVKKFCAQSGGKAAADLRALGAAADVVITMLPEGKIVRRVLLDEGGVVSGLKPGTALVDMSSCSPVDTLGLARELADAGFPLVDAPVSGGVVKAVSGGLAIMAGGDSAAIAACKPLLAHLGKVFETGASGSGHAMKAINNFLSATTLAITSEAVVAGQRFGLDPKVMVDIINASTGRSNSSEHKFPTFILPREFTSGFFLGLMAKDLRFAKALVHSVQEKNIFVDAISALYDEAEKALGGQADNTEIHVYLEQLADKHD
ncbi:MAG: NAD(P)-dependent oxidoreductase [Gammaproteobacteria bacterium]|nr:NAD(P)-dependent oxidoreductase [Gammaproteobacteria bacterium]